MTTLPLFGLAFLLYALTVAISFYKPFHHSPWYLPVGWVLAIGTMSCWQLVAKWGPDRIYQNAAIWDVMVMGLFLFIPILFFDTQLTWRTGLGITLLLTGCVLLH